MKRSTSIKQDYSSMIELITLCFGVYSISYFFRFFFFFFLLPSSLLTQVSTFVESASIHKFEVRMINVPDVWGLYQFFSTIIEII
jgi:hypothetical protein